MDDGPRHLTDADLRRQFAAERSHKDVGSSIEYTKLLIQLLVGGNGLSATALLTLAGALKTESVFAKAISIPCIFYFAGVIFGVLAAFRFGDAQDNYAEHWRHKFENDEESAKKSNQNAHKDQKWAKVYIWIGILAFICGGIASFFVILLTLPGKSA